jgi:hypothetical protein
MTVPLKKVGSCLKNYCCCAEYKDIQAFTALVLNSVIASTVLL